MDGRIAKNKIDAKTFSFSFFTSTISQSANFKSRIRTDCIFSLCFKRSARTAKKCKRFTSRGFVRITRSYAS